LSIINSLLNSYNLSCRHKVNLYYIHLGEESFYKREKEGLLGENWKMVKTARISSLTEIKNRQCDIACSRGRDWTSEINASIFK